MAATPQRGCRLLGSQKSRRFCQIAKSPTSFDPASITSGYRQPLMSAPASVPRVARPSETTAFARSAYITDILFFMLCAIPTVAHSALVKILPPQQSVLLVPSAGSPFGAYAGCLSDDIGRVFAWGPGRSSVRGTIADFGDDHPGISAITTHLS